MKVLSAENIRKLDAYTIEEKPISSIDLMEKASEVFTNYFIKRFKKKKNIVIFCGIGNNGGDGLAVSRLLLKKGFKVKTFILEFSGNYSIDFKTNLIRLKETPNADIEIIKENKKLDFSNFNMIIDAIFGSGISRPIEGFTKDIIIQINNSHLPIVAIDIPSGLSCDKYLDSEKIEATSTLSFELPKLSFLLPEKILLVPFQHHRQIKLLADWLDKPKSQC